MGTLHVSVELLWKGVRNSVLFTIDKALDKTNIKTSKLQTTLPPHQM